MRFRSRIVNSLDVSPENIEEFMRQGMVWVRPRAVTWVTSLRSPTVGALLELTDRHVVGSVKVNSLAAVRLYTKLAVG